MRIRTIKPAFWSDSLLASLSDSARLLYIGLWGVADDAGWLTRDVGQIGHELMGYQSRATREKKTVRLLGELVAAGRVIEHPCPHLEIPTMTAHQHLAGTTKQVRTTFNQHLRECVSAGPRDDPRGPEDPRLVKVSKGRVMGREGKEREGYIAPAGANKNTNDDGATTEFSSRVGSFADIVKGIPR